MLTTPPTILYMEDDSDDVELLQAAIGSIDPSFQMLTASNGEEGLHQLSEMKAAGTLPRLIVLDINMPRMDGRQTLLRIKEDPALSTIPVVAFSTSKSALDKLFFERQHVAYITKPVRFDLFAEVARRLLAYLEE